jgi:hypothetical protein
MSNLRNYLADLLEHDMNTRKCVKTDSETIRKLRSSNFHSISNLRQLVEEMERCNLGLEQRERNHEKPGRSLKRSLYAVFDPDTEFSGPDNVFNAFAQAYSFLKFKVPLPPAKLPAIVFELRKLVVDKILKSPELQAKILSFPIQSYIKQFETDASLPKHLSNAGLSKFSWRKYKQRMESRNSERAYASTVELEALVGLSGDIKAVLYKQQDGCFVLKGSFPCDTKRRRNVLRFLHIENAGSPILKVIISKAIHDYKNRFYNVAKSHLLQHGFFAVNTPSNVLGSRNDE